MGPEWVTAAATVVAFGWAVFLYRQTVREKQERVPRLVMSNQFREPIRVGAGEDVPQPQWRRDGVWHQSQLPSTAEEFLVERRDPYAGEPVVDVAAYDLWVLSVLVSNHSDEAISDVYIGLGGSAKSGRAASMTRVDVVFPGEAIPCVVYAEARKDDSPQWWDAEIAFSDSGGVSWSRRGALAIHRNWLPPAMDPPSIRERLRSATRWLAWRAFRIRRNLRW